ncbi:MAG TPA: LuxR C-terminal-related transcriptional regulator [Chthoniobacteraceae bacterium]|nr:LuxR C-terminal-related transcriptional regulator [Chthoniobacteraceae bacterium]
MPDHPPPPSMEAMDCPDRPTLPGLWEALAAYPASEWEAQLTCLMEWIARAIDADNVIWIATIRAIRGRKAENDPFLGWRLRGRRPLRPDPEPYQRQLDAYYSREHYGKLTPTYYQRSHQPQKEAHIGLTSRASMAGAGSFRVHRLRDGWIDFEAFRRSLHYRLYYEEPGIIDRIWIGFPINEDRESFFMIDRFQLPGQPPRQIFTLEEATLAGDAVRSQPHLQRWLLLGNGLLAGDKLLSPTERQILCELLTAKSEKEIADALGQKQATLHKYITSLYARFGVNGRAALMALWLGGRSP